MLQYFYQTQTREESKVNCFNVLKYSLFAAYLMAIGSASIAAQASSDAVSSSSASDLEVPLRDIRRFTTVIAQIKNNYVEPIQDDKLFDNAIRGLLSNLDPHSRYLDPDDLKQLDVEVSGQLAGIGVELTSDENGDIRVISPLDDSPADKAGIKAGDIFLKIDNSVVNNMSLIEASKKIQGKKGTSVALELLRPGVKKVIKLNIVRDIVKVNHVKSSLIDGDYGYIRIPRFNEAAAADTLKAIKELRQKSGDKLKGLILDLRNNTGGLLKSAVDITDLFLDADKLKGNKKIVYTKGREPGDKVEINATKKDATGGVPVVVLINQGSASSSEIVAGALQDHQRAVILGTKSFGKGSVQTILPVDDKSAISLTTSLYYTPLGRSIQAKGIKPDVQVEDIKIAHSDPNQDGFSYREEDLAGHFDNAQSKESVDGKNKEEKTQVGTLEKKDEIAEKDLAHKDFQLYSALNLLKGLQAVKK